MSGVPAAGPVLGLDDDAFLEHVADALAAVPGVRGVALGGSRAQGANRPDSDWDVAVYYRYLLSGHPASIPCFEPIPKQPSR